MQHAPDTELITVGRAAAMLQVHIETVRRWVRSGEMPHVVLPSGSRRIPLGVVLDCLGEYGAPNIEFITTEQAAALLGVNIHTMGRWAREGKVPRIVLPGGSHRIPREALLASLGGNYDFAGALAKHDERDADVTEKQADVASADGY